MSQIYESLLEMTGQKKGLVEFVDGTVVICDWSPLDGCPRLAVGSMSGSLNPIEVDSETKVASWKMFAEDAASLVNCLGINIENEEDCGAKIFNLSDDISVIVPDSWKGDEKTAPIMDNDKLTGLFCTCKDTTCKYHPINHDEGCTPCMENNLKRGEIPSCITNKAELPRRREGYSIEEFAKTVMNR